jgi:hypothetical protein
MTIGNTPALFNEKQQSARIIINTRPFFRSSGRIHMIQIRPFENRDSIAAGILIADCYTSYILDFVSEDQLANYMGPFFYARSKNTAHQQQIAMFIQSPVVLVAEDENREISGILRGQKGRLHGLFVKDWYFFQNIGRQLVEEFEQYNRQLGSKKVSLAAPLFAVSFYLRIGYKKSTGVRSGWSFQGRGLQWQPMKKVLFKADSSAPAKESVHRT